MNITVRQCMIGETGWFRKLEGEYHYMGESHGVGDLVGLMSVVDSESGDVVAAMMVARSFGMWICARRTGSTTERVRSDLNLHPAKLVRIMMKGGLQ